MQKEQDGKGKSGQISGPTSHVTASSYAIYTTLQPAHLLGVDMAVDDHVHVELVEQVVQLSLTMTSTVMVRVAKPLRCQLRLLGDVGLTSVWAMMMLRLCRLSVSCADLLTCL